MANKERTKRSARKARQKEREELEAARIVANQTPAAKATKSEERTSKAPAKKKQGFFAKTRKYFSDVRSEMHRVVWPTKSELINYSVGVISMLIVFAVSIFLIDNLITWLLTLFAGLKG